MRSKHSSSRMIWLALAGLVIALAGPAGSGTASKPIPITTGDGGWEHVYNLPQGSSVNSLSFLGSDPSKGHIGWAVGNYGLILKTTNGGITWSAQNSGAPDKTLTSAWFIDANNGCVVGTGMRGAPSAGIILRTTDGGVTWQEQNAPEGINLCSVCFVDAKTGWAVGSGDPSGQQRSNECKVLKSTDGGDTWSIAAKLPMRGVMAEGSISFVDAKNGFVCVGMGGSLEGGNILRTTDGGKTWAKPTGIPKGKAIVSVSFIDHNNGWACGYEGLILRTNDGGDTWNRQALSIPDAHLLSIYFADSRNGWASGYGGMLISTSDGGATWSQYQTGTDMCLQTIRFSDSQNGWAAGYDGVILRTTNGGKSWTTQQPRTMRVVLSAEFVDAGTGWITGYRGGDKGRFISGFIYKTTDGGLSWVQQRPSSEDLLSHLRFVDGKHGWAIGPSGSVIATEDGGDTWLRRSSWLNGLSSSATSIHQAQFIDSKRGWILADDCIDSNNPEYSIHRTTDGGNTWETLSTGTLTPILDFWFADLKTGWEVGSKGTLLKTADGGNTWKRNFTGVTKELHAVHFVDSKLGWIVGQQGLILKTTDGGDTWVQQESDTSENLECVRFVNATTGWAGSDKAINWLMTVDGGKTWVTRYISHRDTNSVVCFVDGDHGWMPGLSLLRTTTSGLPGCVWAKKQPDGKAANFGHLVVTEATADGVYAVHPDSKIGIRFRIKDPRAKVGDYIYIHGKIASDGGEKVIDADSVDVITAGWGHITEDSNDKQAHLH